MRRGASRVPVRGLLAEWPTWIALAGCYLVWALSMLAYETVGILAFVTMALSAAFHSSLQHEMLHGHPTRRAAVNEALVWLPLGLFIPYRRFRDLHLRHHNDTRLTDPYDDPESFYHNESDYALMGRIRQALLCANATFAGRMLIGPALALYGFARTERARLRANERGVRAAWANHAAGVAAVVAIVGWMGVPLWLYILLAAYPGMALIMVRSFIEHRAHEDPRQRSAVVESGPFFSLLFLNNNLHRVHHAKPAVAWYRLPALYRAERGRYLAENGGYLIQGYGEVLRRWLLRAREPVVHPYSRREGAGRGE